MKGYLVTFDQTNGQFSIQAGIYSTRIEAEKAFDYISKKNQDCARKGIIIEMDVHDEFNPLKLRKRAREAIGEAVYMCP